MTRPGPVTPDSGDEAVSILEQAWFHAGEILSVAVEQIVERERADERNRIADELDAYAATVGITDDARWATRHAARIARGETP